MNQTSEDTEVDAEGLQRWLGRHVEGAGAEPLEIERIAGGASNLTLLVSQAEHEWVVRRPPLGHFLPTAHDMSREYRFYRALEGSDVPVPRALAFCDDESVIGAPFYVMERVQGVVPERVEDLAGATREQCRLLCEEFVRILASIHAVDFEAVGLGGIGKREGYLERQVRRWTDQWERSKTADCDAIDEIVVRLRRALPKSPPTTIVHGDYRLGNVMLDAEDPARIVAVFDWEMATLGDPLADLGYLLMYWGEGDKPPVHSSQAIADLPGFLSGDALIARYGDVSGRPVDELDYYVVLAYFKLAVIGQGGFARAARVAGETPRELPQHVERLGNWALQVSDNSRLRDLRG